jgi:hypothetical protein
LISLLSAGVLHAQAAPFTLGAEPVWYGLAGLTTGGTGLARDRGYFLGSEISVVRVLGGGRFLGAYADGYYDFGAQRTYTTAGVELGYKFVGVDAGPALRLGGERVEWGATGRLFATLGVASVYCRYAYFIAALSPYDRHVLQIGVLLKVPIVL